MNIHYSVKMYSLVWFGILLFTGLSESQKNFNFLPLEQRVQKMTDLSYRTPVIRLTSASFRSYIGSKSVGQPDRNYTIVVMFNALGSAHQCVVCRPASDEFFVLASSWRYSPHFTNDLFFAMLDFDRGSDIFQQLDINSAPLYFIFKPRSTKTTAFSLKQVPKMDIEKYGFSAESIGRWVHDKTSVNIRVARPIDFTKPLVMFILFGLVALVLYLFPGILRNYFAHGLIALIIVLVMTSGQMWNHIRGPPLMQRSQNGISYISHSSNSQFVMETYIIFSLNAAISIGLILMIESIRSKGRVISFANKKFTFIAGLAMVSVFFLYLLSIFGSKVDYYPFSFKMPF